MKELFSIIVGILLGIYAGAAAAFLVVSHNPHLSNEEALGPEIGWLIFLGGIGVIAGGVLASRLHCYFTSEESERISWQAKLGIIAAILSGVPLLVAWAFHSPLNHDYVPSDRRMIAQFERNRPALEKIVFLSKQQELGFAEYPPRDRGPAKIAEIPEDHQAVCDALLDQAGLPHNVTIDEAAQSIDFSCWGSSGLSRIVAGKGFVYLTTPPPHVLASLDGCSLEGKTKGTFYRHLDGNWYLYFDFDPMKD